MAKWIHSYIAQCQSWLVHMWFAGVAVCLALSGVTSTHAQTRAWGDNGKSDLPLVVCTISVLGDLVTQVAGDVVRVQSIVPLGSDPHTYEPTPSIARVLSQAHLVFRNGLGLERWLDRLVGESSAVRPVITLSDGLKPQWVRDEYKLEVPDPHMWLDPYLVKSYVLRIEQTLAERFPMHAAHFSKRSKSFLEQLERLDQQARTMVATLPVERRKLVTTHDAFRYFSQRYGLTLVASIWGISTDAEPSAQQIARIVQAIRREKVPAVFVETTFNPRLMQRIAHEAGVHVGPPLYGDSLGSAQSGADSYIGMMQSNLRALATGLGGKF